MNCQLDELPREVRILPGGHQLVMPHRENLNLTSKASVLWMQQAMINGDLIRRRGGLYCVESITNNCVKLVEFRLISNANRPKLPKPDIYY